MRRGPPSLRRRETDPAEIPQFNFLLGDIVYNFGEAQYYYDQFHEPYRDYDAPILAAAGNHDGMVSPLRHDKSLQAYLRNFCSDCFEVSPDAGNLSRTAQIQPGVFFTRGPRFGRAGRGHAHSRSRAGGPANAGIEVTPSPCRRRSLRCRLARCRVSPRRLLFLRSFVMPYRASGGCARHAMLARHVPRDAAHHRALRASRCVRLQRKKSNRDKSNYGNCDTLALHGCLPGKWLRR